jgi:hypothetical protein
MHLRMLIPLLAASAINAVEIVPGSGLSLSGYGGAFALFDDREANNPRNTSSAPKQDETVGDFSSEVALNLIYNVDQFTLRADTIIADHPQFDDNNVLLEQAFIDWRVNDYVTVRAGRFQNTWLGWEGFRAPELFRVRHSAAWDWNVENHGLGKARPFVTDGAGVKLATRDRQFISEFYVADDLFGDGPTSDGTDKAVGGCFTWKPDGLGHVELGFGYDPNSVNNGTTTSSSDCYGADINMHLTKWLDQGWFFAAECQVHRHPELTVAGTRYGNDLIALAMANYAITPGKMSVTVMVDYVERGFAADDNEIWEYAVALLTKPHRQVRLNLETYYWAETGERADSYGAGAVLLVALP